MIAYVVWCGDNRSTANDTKREGETENNERVEEFILFWLDDLDDLVVTHDLGVVLVSSTIQIKANLTRVLSHEKDE